MTSWILIVALTSPGGDFVGKYPVPYTNEKTCRQALKETKNPVEIGDPLGIKAKGWLCVSRAHWEGKVQDKGVAFD